MIHTVLTIAGSDCSGGAGIQADIKTIAAHGDYAMSVVTALTAQNTTKVLDIHPVPPDFMKAQLEAVFMDIPPQAVKIGMLPEGRGVLEIAEALRKYAAKNIVIDPVMVATSGSKLSQDETIALAKEQLFSMAVLLTPNLPETEALAGMQVADKDAMCRAAERIGKQYGCAVLCKGGHLEGSADDLLFDKDGMHWLEGEYIDNPNTHGTGCTLSSAIACGLAAGLDVKAAVIQAKEYLTGAIRDGLDLGHGRGPLNHMYKR